MSRRILIAGASSESGHAIAAALTDAGAEVIAVGSNLERLATVAAVARYETDLTDAAAVDALAVQVHSEYGALDGLIHLVGGWRGGHSAEDWTWLRERNVDTFRNTSLSFRDDLLASTAGRLVMISSTAVDSPTWGNANYVAAKSASEGWARAMAGGFAKSGTAASVILVVRSIGDGDGETPVATLARRIATMWHEPADELNGSRILVLPR